MIRGLVRSLAVLVALTLYGVLARSSRADPKEWTLALAPAYAVTYVDARNPSGVGVGVDLGYGVSESLSLRAIGFASWHSVDATKTQTAGTLGAFAGMLGLTYAIDVIRLVPTFEGAIGVLGIRGDPGFRSGPAADKVIPASTAFGVELGFALDYLISRRVALGLIVRYHAFLSDLTRVPVYLYVGPRLSLHFGG